MIFQPDMLLLHIHIQYAFHIYCMYLWAYVTKGTVQLGKIPVKPDTCCPWES